MNILKKLSIIAMLALGFAASSCDVEQICTKGTGPDVVDTLSVLPFTGINMSIAADVYLHKGPVQLVEVHGKQNLIDKLKLDVDSDIWKIDFQGCVWDKEDFEVHITLPEIDYIKISGAGNVISQDTFSTTDMELIVSGAGDMDLAVIATNTLAKINGAGNIVLDLDTDFLDSDINGAGDLELEGVATTHNIRVRGSGNVKAFDLITDQTEVHVSGAGDAKVTANQQLDVKVGGAGNVYYKGSPSINVEISGAGSVIDAN